MQQKSKMSMAENTILINECNTLRRENRKLQQTIAALRGSLRTREAAESTSNLEKVRWRKLPPAQLDPRKFSNNTHPNLGPSASAPSLQLDQGSALPEQLQGQQEASQSQSNIRHPASTSEVMTSTSLLSLPGSSRRNVSTAAVTGNLQNQPL